jgi:hypothetical protein
MPAFSCRRAAPLAAAAALSSPVMPGLFGFWSESSAQSFGAGLGTPGTDVYLFGGAVIAAVMVVAVFDVTADTLLYADVADFSPLSVLLPVFLFHFYDHSFFFFISADRTCFIICKTMSLIRKDHERSLLFACFCDIRSSPVL